MGCKKINIQVNDAIGCGTGSYDLIGSNGAKIFRSLSYADLGTTASGLGITFSVNTNNTSFTFSNYTFPSTTNCDECNCIYEDTTWYKSSELNGNNFSAANTVTDMKIQSDEKLLVAFSGTFNIGTQSWAGKIIRFNKDGTLDTTFKDNIGLTGFSGGSISKFYQQQDDKLLVVGASFMKFNGSTASIKRFNTDGTDDLVFKSNIGYGVDPTEFASTRDISVDSNNRITVVGSFTKFVGTSASITRRRIVKLNSDGTEYTTFYNNLIGATGTGFNSDVSSIISMTSSIIVAGAFTSLNTVTRKNITKINDDGTEDISFYNNLLGATGTGFSTPTTINSIVKQIDGKILVIGSGLKLNGNNRGTLLRLNTDGSEDTSFYNNLVGATGSGFSTLSGAIYKNNKIIVFGNFSSFNGITRNGIVRLNDDGTEDISFYNYLSLNGFYSGNGRFNLGLAVRGSSYNNYIILGQQAARMYINTMSRSMIKIIDEC